LVWIVFMMRPQLPSKKILVVCLAHLGLAQLQLLSLSRILPRIRRRRWSPGIKANRCKATDRFSLSWTRRT